MIKDRQAVINGGMTGKGLKVTSVLRVYVGGHATSPIEIERPIPMECSVCYACARWWMAGLASECSVASIGA